MARRKSRAEIIAKRLECVRLAGALERRRPSQKREQAPRAPNASRSAVAKSRDPDQARIVRAALIGNEVPIFAAWVPSGMTVQKCEIGAVVMEIGMHVILLSDRREPP